MVTAEEFGHTQAKLLEQVFNKIFNMKVHFQVINHIHIIT